MRAPYREFGVAVPCVTFPAAVFPFRMATRMITKGGGHFGTSMNLGGAPPMGSSWEGGHCYLYTHANCLPLARAIPTACRGYRETRFPSSDADMSYHNLHISIKEGGRLSRGCFGALSWSRASLSAPEELRIPWKVWGCCGRF